MQSHDKVYQKLLLMTVALLLSSVELALPRIPAFPWIKIGLANLITITWLVRYGFRDTLLYGFLRIWLSIFFFGFSFFSALLALSGMVIAVTAMGVCTAVNRRKEIFGAMGIGVVGAFFHNIGQLAMLNLLIGEASLVSIQIPAMSAISLITGMFTGFLAFRFQRIEFESFSIIPPSPNRSLPIWWKQILTLLLFGVMVAVLLISTITPAAIFAIVSLAVSFIASNSIANALSGVRRFGFFLIVLFTITWIVSGGELATVQLLRVFGWLQCSVIFRALESERLFFWVLHRLFPTRESTLEAALLTVDVFPQMMKKGAFNLLEHPKESIKNPDRFLCSIVETGESVLQQWEQNPTS